MKSYDDTAFAYATGRISAIEKHLLTPAKLDALKHSTSADDIIKILSDAGYDASGIDSTETFEKMLSKEKEKLYSLINELSGGTSITGIFLLKNDYHNLKVLIKQEFSKTPIINDESLFTVNGNIHPDRLALLYVNRDFSGLSDIMKNAIKRSISQSQAHHNPQEVDIILDKALYEEMKSKSIDTKNEYLSSLVAVMADLVNIKTFLRVKRLKKNADFLKKALVIGGDIAMSTYLTLADEGEDKFFEMLDRTRYHTLSGDAAEQMAQFEEKCDAYLMEYVSSAVFSPMGIEPIVSYLLKKENEIKAIRIIMLGKEQPIWKSA